MASLFHSLVVIGAGVSASACGGVTNVSSGGTPDEAAGRNGAGGGAGRGAGASLNAGAQSGIGVGGTAGRAGTGGAGGDVLSIDPAISNFPLPDPGTLAQWNCTDQLGGCDSPLDGMQIKPYYLASPCPIDTSRPRSATDCASDEWFRCLSARTGDVVIAVNCECAPMLDAGCSCDGVGPSYRHTVVCHDRDMTCGCAYTGILVH